MKLTRRGELVMALVVTPLATIVVAGLLGTLMWMMT